MKTSINFLPIEKQRELNDIVEFIKSEERSSLPIHMIILFGSFARGTWVEDKYVEGGTTYEYQSDYDILFVMSHEKHARNSSFTKGIINRIIKNVEIDTRFNPIFHGINYLNGELKERNYFFMDIFNEGILLFDSEHYIIESPPHELPKDTRLMKARYYYEKWLNSADGFLRGFDSYYENKEYSLAVFHLHQTAEHLFMGINLVYTDYKPKSHNLIELHNRSIEFNEEFREAFPCRTKEEQELFKKLNDAYIDSRYEKNYVISVPELDYMCERVKVLQRLAEKLCKDFIVKFAEGIADISDELMQKIKATDASIDGFYEARERARLVEQKKVEAIKLEERRENTLKIALELVHNEVDIAVIAKSTGLTFDEIDKLK